MARPQRRRWLLVLAGLLVVAWVVGVGLVLLSAHRDIRRGLTAVDAARNKANAAAVVEGRLVPELETARLHFATARDRVDSPLLAPARIMPFVGRQLRSVSALSGAATTVADVGIAGMNDAQPILVEPGGSNAARAASARRLGQLAARAEAELRGIGLGPRVGLVSPLARARNRLGDQIAGIQAALGKGAKGGTAVADLLEGPRRYLLFAANNAEMRAGSGMFLTAGELETGPQGLRLGPMRSVTEIPIPAGTVPLSGDVAERWGWLEPNRDWRNLMLSPRFDANAPLAAEMWSAAGNQRVDGVMVLDPVALGGLLRGTGPVEVEGRRFSQGNIEEELLHAQYVRLPAGDDRPERREALGKIAGAVFGALDAGKWSLANLAAGLADVSSGRHLLLWTSNPSEQAAWAALGVDGALHDDSLLLSVQNRGGNKLDRFLRVEADMKVANVAGETEVTVTVRLENQVPPGEPRYVAGPHPLSGVGEGVYVGLFTLNVPGAAHDGRIEGVENLAVQGDDGPSRVLGFQFELPRGGQRTVVTRFRLPLRSGSMRVEPSARVPAIRWQSGSTTWDDASAKVVSWAA